MKKQFRQELSVVSLPPLFNRPSFLVEPKASWNQLLTNLSFSTAGSGDRKRSIFHLSVEPVIVNAFSRYLQAVPARCFRKRYLQFATRGHRQCNFLLPESGTLDLHLPLRAPSCRCTNEQFQRAVPTYRGTWYLVPTSCLKRVFTWSQTWAASEQRR